jgi:hypothetical protein
MKLRFLFGCLLLLCQTVQAQLNNSPFYSTEKDTLEVGEAGVFLDHLNFTKNNEYFTKITDGYTLFGFQLMPTVRYRFHPDFSLEGGMFLRKDYGISGIQEFEPVLTARIRKGSHQILMGTLDGGLQHGLIEPFYEFENQLISRLENGLQWKFQNRKFSADAWIDWRTMIYDYSPKQEEVFGGIVLNRKLVDSESWVVSLDFQGTAYHKGGQIDTIPNPLITWFHAAPGFKVFFKNSPTAGFRGLGFQAFVPAFLDYSFSNKLPFNKNLSPYLNLSAEFSHGTLMFSYWQSEGFQHYRGGRLYRTVSSSIHQPGRIEKRRQLLIIRWMSDFKIGPDIWLSTRIEPYFDLENNFWEFSHGMYLNFRSRVKKPKSFKDNAGNK